MRIKTKIVPAEFDDITPNKAYEVIGVECTVGNALNCVIKTDTNQTTVCGLDAIPSDTWFNWYIVPEYED